VRPSAGSAETTEEGRALPINTDTPQSEGWWLEVLSMQLHERRVGRRGSQIWTRNKVASSRMRPGLLLLEDYLRGDPPLQQDIHGGWADPFRRFLRMGRLNMAELLVSARTNRMGIRDFRTSAAEDELGDAEARKLMRANKLKLISRDVHEYMCGLGDGYTIVTPPDGTDVPSRREHSLITAESPLQCITAHDAATGRTLAGLKLFRDEWEELDWAYLFLPGRLHVARLEGPTSIRTRGAAQKLATRWAWDDEKSDDVPGNRVAMVRFRNKGGVGEFEHHLNHLDRINDKLFNEWWIGKIQAFRQRAIKLADEDQDELDEALETQEMQSLDASATDNPLYAGDASDLAGIFTSSPDAMWRLPKDADIWESTPVDVGPLVNSIQKELQNLAAATSTPLHTITPDAANGSAEGAQLMREEHVYTIEDRRDRADGSWAETMAMAFEFQGDDERADVTQLEAIWGPAERYSLAEKSDAASKQKGITPNEAILTDVLQYSPADVQDRLRSLRSRDLIFLAPQGAPAGQPPGQGAPTAGA